MSTRPVQRPHPRALRWGALVLLSTGFLVFGLWRGEAAVVLQKGIKVCLECIGIG